MTQRQQNNPINIIFFGKLLRVIYSMKVNYIQHLAVFKTLHEQKFTNEQKKIDKGMMNWNWIYLLFVYMKRRRLFVARVFSIELKILAYFPYNRKLQIVNIRVRNYVNVVRTPKDFRNLIRTHLNYNINNFHEGYLILNLPILLFNITVTFKITHQTSQYYLRHYKDFN